MGHESVTDNEQTLAAIGEEEEPTQSAWGGGTLRTYVPTRLAWIRVRPQTATLEPGCRHGPAAPGTCDDAAETSPSA